MTLKKIKKIKETFELYPHQKDAVEAMSIGTPEEDVYRKTGQVYLPTGTGKTFVQADYLSRYCGSPNIFVVTAPRITLTYQLLEEYNRYLASKEKFPELMFVHSGGTGSTEELNKVRSRSNQDFEVIATTSSEEIAGKIKSTIDNDKSIILFSTYESLDRIRMACEKVGQKVKCAMFDEAHYLVQDSYHKTLEKFVAEEKFFFTATARHTESDESTGMNNRKVYGGVLYELKIASAIAAGLCVRPRAHILETDSTYNSDDFKESIPKIIRKAVLEHEEQIYNESFTRGHVRKPKLLITVQGTRDIDSFFGSSYKEELVEEGYAVYAISARHGAVVNDLGNKINRSTWLIDLKKAIKDPQKKVLVLHYDILSEGIDASDFTGVLILRDMPISKFLQTFGRVSRLDQRDREAFRAGEYKPEDTGKMRKPYAYVIFPMFTKGNLDSSERFRSFIELMRTMGACLDDLVFSPSLGDGTGDDEDNFLDNLEETHRRLGEEIKNITSDVESEELADRLYAASTSNNVKDFLAVIADI